MKKGFTLVELLVIIAVIAIVTVVLFPIFAKARESREKARQTTCWSNQKQIALSIAMFTQENEEVLPETAKNWAASIGLAGRVMICPSAAKNTNSYGYNENIAGLSVYEIPSPIDVVLTADATAIMISSPDDLAPRHMGKIIASFVAGHVEVVSIEYAKATLQNIKRDSDEYEKLQEIK